MGPGIRDGPGQGSEFGCRNSRRGLLVECSEIKPLKEAVLLNRHHPLRVAAKPMGDGRLYEGSDQPARMFGTGVAHAGHMHMQGACMLRPLPLSPVISL